MSGRGPLSEDCAVILRAEKAVFFRGVVTYYVTKDFGCFFGEQVRDREILGGEARAEILIGLAECFGDAPDGFALVVEGQGEGQ